MVRILLIFVLLLCGCRGYFFYPESKLLGTPADFGREYKEVSLTTPDGCSLHSWLLPAEKKRASILFLHGNAENISTHVRSVLWFAEHGYEVLVLEYRGYGQSTCSPDVPGLITDAQTGLSYLLALDKLPIIIYGQSLGGAIAIATAAQIENQPRVKLLIAEGAFSSYRAIAREKFGWLGFLVQDSYSPKEEISKIRGFPILLVHGLNDEIVPAQHSRELYRLANEPKMLWEAPDVGHIQVFSGKEWREKLLLEFKKD